MAVKLFIGTSITPDLAKHVGERSQLQAGTGLWYWAPSAQWHITTLFIGSRKEEEIMTIAGAVERTCQACKGFALQDGRLVAMPQERPSMLWVRFDPSEELSALHHELATATSTPPSQYDPMWPHITLARGKGPLPTLSTAPIVHQLVIGELSLFRSDPGPEGTVHTALGTWPLL